MANTHITGQTTLEASEPQVNLTMEIRLPVASLVVGASAMLTQRKYFHVGPMKLKTFHDFCVGLLGNLKMMGAHETKAMVENIEQMITAAQQGEDGVADIGGNDYEFIFSPNPMYRPEARHQYHWKLSLKTIRKQPTAPETA